MHVPFCWDRCTYCAFPTVADDSTRHESLIGALIAEARQALPIGPLGSLYLGGGTPGLVHPTLLGRLNEALRALFAFKRHIEITLEVNPANVTAARLAQWEALGVTRLSVGVQTFREDVLRDLGRRHDARAARTALDQVARLWRRTWSADLLVGWHGQDQAALCDDIEQLTAFAPPHVSVYGLTVEHGTPLASRAARGLSVTAPTERLERFDDSWSDRLGSLGFERYEVSNFAQPGHRSRHNQSYWSNASYLGLGPGACSSMHPYRWTNRPDLEGYLEATRRGRGLRLTAEQLDPMARLLETLSIGLRTRDGLSVAGLHTRFGPAWEQLVRTGGTDLLADGLLSLDHEQLRIPERHLTKADRIVLDLARKTAASEVGPQGRGLCVGNA
ncbi:MAG: radical SAM family heme chaperone HemW [Planctomycetota bacterium]